MSADVNFICKIDRELYRVVENDLVTDEVVLRLKVSSDPEEYKNSIITLWKISAKRYRRLLRQSEILYKKE